MFKFKTIKCSHCGTVIFNLPETDARKLHNISLICEDCSYINISNEFEPDDICTSYLREIKCSA
ncbi:hypothetical protein Bccel_2926 [Pseudobacteroides cellulosolvens ATCC 35603 = DSM 2933]|uniref:Uncharacterized protein n=1 Tax=Pseudobacteroides cellulosolvens ATCC 35603 = DSM 2933 TaxID=398512 RepID=A0A0L6JPL4_9FIRM|nr:hypothetical protein Bccel_2926 [Pseudobacteroides cellulosolvens ATCC 35603 = DSM 2933]